MYAVSRNGTVAWAPLKFFLPSELYDNAFEAGGYYAFCQRPSSRDIQQYGILAYYRDKDKLSGIYGAPTEIHASDIIISTVNLPDNIARLVEQGKSSFIEYLNHFAKEDTKYLNRSYEITVTYMGEKKGHFNVRTYVKRRIRGKSLWSYISTQRGDIERIGSVERLCGIFFSVH